MDTSSRARYANLAGVAADHCLNNPPSSGTCAGRKPISRLICETRPQSIFMAANSCSCCFFAIFHAAHFQNFACCTRGFYNAQDLYDMQNSRRHIICLWQCYIVISFDSHARKAALPQMKIFSNRSIILSNDLI